MLQRVPIEAIVLFRAPIGEAHLLVTLLTRSAGKHKALAPGARRSRKRFGGCLDLFSLIETILVGSGHGGAQFRLEEASLKDGHEGLKGDLVSLGQAGHLVELVDGMITEGEPAEDAFDELGLYLSRLDRRPLSSVELRRFEIWILTRSGLIPDFQHCQACQRDESARWSFDPEQGGLLCCACPPGPDTVALTPPARLLLASLQADLPVPQALDLATMAEARELLAGIIERYLGRPLKSQEFLRQLAAKGVPG